MNKLLLNTIVTFFSISIGSAQMLIGDKNSTHPMEVKTQGENTIVTEDGRMGVQMNNPILKMDLRSLSEEGTLAIGWTDQTAAQAGKGALRYNPSPTWGGVQGFIEYSDGTVWVPFHPEGKPRIVVMAEKNNDIVRVDAPGYVSAGTYTGGVPPRTSTFIPNWDVRVDMDSGTPQNNWNNERGEFVAPRTGVYLATFAFALDKAPVQHEEHNYWEAIWQVLDSNRIKKYDIKSNNGYPSDSGSAPAGVVVGSYCTAMLYMEEGDIARPFIWGKTEWTLRPNDPNATKYDATKRPFIKNKGFNSLTIIEQ